MEPKLTRRERRKLLAHFKRDGREAVRERLARGAYGENLRRGLATKWLREQERIEEQQRRWTLDAAVAGAMLAAIGALAALGIIR